MRERERQEKRAGGVEGKEKPMQSLPRIFPPAGSKSSSRNPSPRRIHGGAAQPEDESPHSHEGALDCGPGDKPVRLPDLKDIRRRRCTQEFGLPFPAAVRLDSVRISVWLRKHLTMPHQKPAELLLNASVCLQWNRSTMPVCWGARDVGLHLPQLQNSAVSFYALFLLCTTNERTSSLLYFLLCTPLCCICKMCPYMF